MITFESFEDLEKSYSVSRHLAEKIIFPCGLSSQMVILYKLAEKISDSVLERHDVLFKAELSLSIAYPVCQIQPFQVALNYDDRVIVAVWTADHNKSVCLPSVNVVMSWSTPDLAERLGDRLIKELRKT